MGFKNMDGKQITSLLLLASNWNAAFPSSNTNVVNQPQL